MALAFPQMFGLLAGGAITTATGEYERDSPLLRLGCVTCLSFTDASDSSCPSNVRHQCWISHHLDHRDIPRYMGNFVGLHRTWSRSWGQRASHCCTGNYENVGIALLSFSESQADQSLRDNDIFLANGKIIEVSRSLSAQKSLGIASFCGQLGG